MAESEASPQRRHETGKRYQALIVADSSTAMGQGHLMRCQTLALALLRQGWQVVLCGQALSGHGLARAVEFFQREAINVEYCSEHQITMASSPSTALRIQLLTPQMSFTPEQLANADTQRLLARQLMPILQQTTQQSAKHSAATTMVLVDHYSIDAPFYLELRRQSQPLLLVAIDDLANRQLPVDLLLDQNFQAPEKHTADPRVAQLPSAAAHMTPNKSGALVGYVQTPWRYRGLLPTTCLTLIGPSYALLRDEFVERRIEPCQLTINAEIRRLLISFGGSDPSCFTEKLLTALQTLSNQAPELNWLAVCSIDVVVGNAYPNLPALQALATSMPLVTLHVQTQQMAQLIANADLCIGATGGSTWERALLGCPTIAYWLAPNQLPALEALEQVGAIINAGPAALFDPAQLQHMLMQLTPEQRLVLAQQARQLMGQGTGAASVARTLGNLIQSNRLQCRKVTLADAKLLLDWANDPEVRSQGFNPEPISLATHLAWLERRLAATDELFYIISLADTPIAQVRFSAKTDHQHKPLYNGSEIHISIAHEARGQGLAAAVLQAAVREALLSPIASSWHFIDALVRCSNLASSQSFRRAGFVDFSDTDVKGIPCRWLRRFVLE